MPLYQIFEQNYNIIYKSISNYLNIINSNKKYEKATQKNSSNKLSLQLQFLNVIIKAQQLFYKSKIKQNEKSLVFIKLLMLISIILEIYIISEKSGESLNNNNTIFKLLKRSILNFKMEDNVTILIIFSLVQIYFTAFLIFAFFCKDHYFTSAFLKYIIIIHHLTIIQPIINVTFHNIANSIYTYFSISLSMFGIFQELLFCIFYTKNNLMKVEGCYSKRLSSLLKLCCMMLVSFFKSYSTTMVIGQNIWFLFKCFQSIECLQNYHLQSTYYSQLNLLVISHIITLLANQNWIGTLLIYVLLLNLRIEIRLRKLQTELIDNRQKNNMFKYQLLENKEFANTFKELNYIFQKIQLEKMKQYQIQTISNGKVPDKFFMILQVFQHKKIQLYLNLINISKQSLTYFHKIRLEANLLNVIESCQTLITSPLNIGLYIKSLKEEQHNFSVLIKLIDEKTSFYQFLIKDAPANQYILNFRIELHKIISCLQNTKQLFENKYDLPRAKLRDFNNSDQASINIIKSYYQIFFNDYFQFRALEKKQNEFLVYDKIMNQKIMKNEAILISVSYIKDQFQILNKNNKRLLSLIQAEQAPQKLIELLPPFQNAIYTDFISQYIYQGFEIQQPAKLYFEINNFLTEYDLFISTTISNDDIVLHNFIVQKNQPSHFILFDPEGRIRGISQQIYSYFTQKSENAFNKTLSAKDFITSGMIQYYVNDINNLVIDLCKLVAQGNMQNVLFLESRWQFPVNHKKCLEQTSMLGLIADDVTTPSHFKKIFYSSSTKRVLLQVKKNSTSKNDEVPQLRNVKIKMIQKSFVNQIQSLVVSASRLKSLEFQGTLEFFEFKFLESDSHYFVLCFREIEEFQQKCITQNHKEQENQLFIQNEAQYDGLAQDYLVIQDIINSKSLYSPLKYDILLVVLMILISISALILSYHDNYQVTINYQEKVNFLNIPQAITFCLAEPFLLNWNKYCVENGLYQLSPLIENQRQNMMNTVFNYCKSINQDYIMQLSRKSHDFGVEKVNLIFFTLNHIKQATIVDIFELYTIIQESVIRQYHQGLSSEVFDFSIFKTDGIMRQNILTIFQYHDLTFDLTIAETVSSQGNYTQNNFFILIYFSIVIFFLLFVFVVVNYKLIKCQEKMVRLLRFLNQQMILDHIKQLQTQKLILTRLMLKNIQLAGVSPSQKSIENTIQIKQKQNTLNKIENFTEKYIIILLVTSVIGVQLIMFIFGSQLVAMSYITQYENSLILTMQYLKLKNSLDSAILIGELIKTESHIATNNMSFINQTEHIEYFMNNIEILLNLSTQINDNLASSWSDSTTFQQRLIDIFNNNLCKSYANLLSFCNIEQIKLEYFETDNYASLIENGIYGIIQVLSKLTIQEYSYEGQTLTYEQDENHSQRFLHMQLHQNLFVQYFIEIQVCIYNCFLDVFSETQKLSDILLNRILIYLIASSFMQEYLNHRFIIFTSSVAGFWINLQKSKLHQIKLIATLFPPALLQQKGFNKLLYTQLLQIK